MRRVVWAVLALLLAAWMGSFGAVALASRQDTAERADVIVVLGAAQYNGRPSPVLKARLDQGADLYRQHLAPLIMVTGGVGEGDSVSEAEVGRRYLMDVAGIPADAVRAEAAGHTSDASLRAVVRALPPGRHRVILVSDGFHMFRLGIIARRLGLDPRGSPAPTSPIRANRRRELGYMLAESVKAPAAFILTRGE